MLDITIPVDGHKNVTVLVKGILDDELRLTPILLTEKLSGQPKKMKLTEALWLVQEKMGMALWWARDDLILPMESRNSIRLDRGWDSPKDWQGIIMLSSFNWSGHYKYFTLEIGFDKQ
jgi:hypothetical protein